MADVNIDIELNTKEAERTLKKYDKTLNQTIKDTKSLGTNTTSAESSLVSIGAKATIAAAAIAGTWAAQITSSTSALTLLRMVAAVLRWVATPNLDRWPTTAATARHMPCYLAAPRWMQATALTAISPPTNAAFPVPKGRPATLALLSENGQPCFYPSY